MKKRRRKTRLAMTRTQRSGRKGATVMKRRQRVRDAALVLSFLVIISLFCVWSRVAAVQTGYRTQDLAREYRKLEDQYRALRLELATQKSPNRLVPLAEKQLGLKHPKPSQIVIVPGPVRIAGHNRESQ